MVIFSVKKGAIRRFVMPEDLFHQMDQARRDCMVPSYMVPKCLVCGGDMAKVISDLNSRNSI